MPSVKQRPLEISDGRCFENIETRNLKCSIRDETSCVARTALRPYNEASQEEGEPQSVTSEIARQSEVRDVVRECKLESESESAARQRERRV